MSDHALGGRVALVTGASSGLGLHMARVLARAGAHVVLAARRLEVVQQEAAALLADGLVARGERLDVSDADEVRALVRRLEDTSSGISIVVNNAGFGLIKSAVAHTDDDWRKVLDVNLTGAWNVAQASARAMLEAGRAGSIVNIASVAGVGATKHTAAYAASKAALVHLTRQLALEWAPAIRVNAICPGYFPTEMTAGMLEQEGVLAKLERRVPLGRIGALKDLDGPLLLLTSDASSFITGVMLAVDGGQLIGSL